MNTPTPETDAESFSIVYQGELVYASFVRKLERERDELKNAINGLCEHLKIQPASTTLLGIEILRMQGKLNEMTEILQDYNKLAQSKRIIATFDAWQEIEIRIELALKKP